MAATTIQVRDQERIARVRKFRQYREEYLASLWGGERDEMDIFGLKYLFDEEEIQKEKQQLVEYEDAYAQSSEHYWYMLFEDDSEESTPSDSEEEALDEKECVLPPEDWDAIEYNICFDMLLGLFTRQLCNIEKKKEWTNHQDANKE